MNSIEIKNRLWVTRDDKTLLGEGRIRLLESIEFKGSINKAAQAMEMSYKKAWKLINDMNQTAGEAIVIRQTGGAGGGGTVLTEKGKKIVKEYRRIDKKCKELLARELENCCF